ncbi:MAG TPA: HlyD family type I secretion periplasmic adaptor subunit [Alphaproteobacteria bacterium]|nr:HlyD family type I secretion periplasmic adaptor subunit [Alphaproteobacteria bacterium]
MGSEVTVSSGASAGGGLPAEPIPAYTAPTMKAMGMSSRLWLALIVIGIFFGAFGLWAAFAPLQSGAIAYGQVTVAGNRKTVQHLEGGIVKDILVREGDTVEASQLLLRFDGTQAETQIRLLGGRLAAAMATRDRLMAEQNEADEITFQYDSSQPMRDRQSEYLDILLGQQEIFNARRSFLDSQSDLTQQRIAQLREEIKGLSAEVQAQERQLALIKEETDALEILLKKGFARKPRILELKRQAAVIAGEREKNLAAIARARQRIVEAELALGSTRTRFMNEVVMQLRETEEEIADLRDRIIAASDILERLQVRAPVSGRIVNSQVFTEGGVIAPGAPLMDIVPADELLIVEARIDPLDIDIVYPGLESEIRLSSYRTDEVQTIFGQVEDVSADSLIDPATGRSYYTARVVIDAGVSLPDDKRIYPGMPVELVIVAGHRTVLSYLFEPLSRRLGRAMRES